MLGCCVQLKTGGGFNMNNGYISIHIVIALMVSALLVVGCSVSGKYRGDGPCKGFREDPQACERAYENSLVASKVQIGQSPTEVRAIMGRNPERREATATSEVWSYLTDYTNQILTVIVFKQGVVVEIKHANARIP
jgi:hypothetical protein